MPRQLLHSLTGLALAAVTGIATAFTISKVLRDEAWSGLDLYAVPEEWALVAMLASGLVIALVAPLFGIVLVAYWWLRREHFSLAPRVSTRQFVRLPIVIGTWYVFSGAWLFSLDCSFTRLGGTTPFCYDHPALFVYQPVASALFRMGLHGGGRTTRAQIDGTWRSRPVRSDPRGPAAAFFLPPSL